MTGETAGRRAFFRLLAREAVVHADQARGIPQLRLADLPSVPDRQLATLAPMIPPNVEILPGEHHIHARLKPGADPIVLFQRKEPEIFLFNRFNGRRALGQIASDLAGLPGWTPEEAFSVTRAFFLKLVGLRVSVPGNPTP